MLVDTESKWLDLCASGEGHELKVREITVHEPLVGVTFTDCHFDQIKFDCDEIQDCTFIDCAFVAPVFSSLKITDCKFRHCRLYDADSESGAMFRFASLAGTCFEDCDLSMADFSRANLYRAEIVNCRLQGSDFSHTSTESEIGGKVSLFDLTVSDVNFAYSNFTGADLRGSSINDSRLIHTDFTSANLDEASVTNCDLHGLSAAGLSLKGADLRGSTLSGLDVREIDMQGVTIDPTQQHVLLEAIGIQISD